MAGQPVAGASLTCSARSSESCGVSALRISIPTPQLTSQPSRLPSAKSKRTSGAGPAVGPGPDVGGGGGAGGAGVDAGGGGAEPMAVIAEWAAFQSGDLAGFNAKLKASNLPPVTIAEVRFDPKDLAGGGRVSALARGLVGTHFYGDLGTAEEKAEKD